MRSFGLLEAKLPLPFLHYLAFSIEHIVVRLLLVERVNLKRKKEKKMLALLPQIEVLCLYLHYTTITTLDKKMNIQMITLTVGCVSYISLILYPDHYTTTL